MFPIFEKSIDSRRLAPRRAWAGGAMGCASARTQYVACTVAVLAAAALGCGSDHAPPGSDGGSPEDDGAVGTGTVVLSAEVDLGEGGATLELGRVGVRELRVRNDRGGDFEPRLESVGLIDLLRTEPQVVLEGAPPATYGRVTVRLGPDDAWGHALELQLGGVGRSVWITSDAELDLDVRCVAPAVLAPGGTLQVTLMLELGEIDDVLEGMIPEEGDVHIDADREPEVLDAVERSLSTAWKLTCQSLAADGAHES